MVLCIFCQFSDTGLFDFTSYFLDDEDEELDAEVGSASKKRRSAKSVKAKKSALNKCAYSYAVP